MANKNKFRRERARQRRATLMARTGLEQETASHWLRFNGFDGLQALERFDALLAMLEGNRKLAAEILAEIFRAKPCSRPYDFDDPPTKGDR